MTASQHSGEVVTGWGWTVTRFGFINTELWRENISEASIASRASGTERENDSKSTVTQSKIVAFQVFLRFPNRLPSYVWSLSIIDTLWTPFPGLDQAIYKTQLKLLVLPESAHFDGNSPIFSTHIPLRGTLDLASPLFLQMPAMGNAELSHLVAQGVRVDAEHLPRPSRTMDLAAGQIECASDLPFDDHVQGQ